MGRLPMGMGQRNLFEGGDDVVGGASYRPASADPIVWADDMGDGDVLHPERDPDQHDMDLGPVAALGNN